MAALRLGAGCNTPVVRGGSWYDSPTGLRCAHRLRGGITLPGKLIDSLVGLPAARTL